MVVVEENQDATFRRRGAGIVASLGANDPTLSASTVSLSPPPNLSQSGDIARIMLIISLKISGKDAARPPVRAATMQRVNLSSK